MNYITTIPFSLEDVSGDLKLVYTPFSNKLYYKGELIKKKGLFSSYKLETTDGRVEELKIQRNLKFVYAVIFRGQRKNLEDPMSALDCFIGYLPLLLVFLGGAIGGVIGFFAASFNFSVIRHESRIMKKYAIVVGITLLSFIVYFILYKAILLLLATINL